MRPIILIFLFSLTTQTCFGKTTAFTDSTTSRLVARVLALTFQMEYEAAFTTIDSLKIRLPDHAIIPLLHAGVIYCRMMDYEDELEMAEFEAYYDRAWVASERLIEEGEAAEGHLYLGVALGFRGLIHQRLGKWWPAVRQGLKAVKHMKRCLEMDSTYYDAYLGVGTYKYWSSRATDFINWLPLIPDKKDAGIELMRVAMEKGLFGREISRSTLAWTLMDYNKPSEAIKLSLEGLETYPGSRYFLWTLANGYYKIGHLSKAARVYQQLFDSLHAMERNNYYNEIGICKKMAFIYLAQNRPEKALEWIDHGLTRPVDDNVKERRKKSLKKLHELKITAEERVAENSAEE